MIMKEQKEGIRWIMNEQKEGKIDYEEEKQGLNGRKKGCVLFGDGQNRLKGRKERKNLEMDRRG